MSGLVAFLATGPSGSLAEPSAAALDRMVRAAPHRGLLVRSWWETDVGIGVCTAPSDDAFSGAGWYEDQALVVAMTGCVFRGEDVLGGDRGAGEVAEALRVGGPQAAAAVRGAFAAAVFDRRERRLIGIRSRGAERPLFWFRLGGLVGIASEVKQLDVLPADRPGIDEGALLDLVAGRHWAPARTAFRGIERVRSGGWVLGGSTTAEEGRAWDPAGVVATSDLTVRDAVEEFRGRLRVAVARRLGTEAALLLSGGLDSSAVAVEAAPQHRARFGVPLPVVSATYPHLPSVDEARYVSQTASALECSLTWVRPRFSVFSDVARDADLHDGPVGAPLSSNFRAFLQAARAQGARVVLDGHPGDNVLGVMGGAVAELLRRRHPMIAAGHVVFLTRRLGLREGLRRGLQQTLRAAGMLQSVRRRRARSASGWLPEWVGPPLAGHLLDRTTESEEWTDREVLFADAALEDGLEVLDRLAGSEGVALRHPFADADLLEFLLSLPVHVKMAGGAPKALVRRGCPELPRAVRERRDKTVFNDLVRASSAPEDAVAVIERSPGKLAGIDWELLRDRAAKGRLSAGEVMLLLRVLQADLLLGSTR